LHEKVRHMKEMKKANKVTIRHISVGIDCSKTTAIHVIKATKRITITKSFRKNGTDNI